MIGRLFAAAVTTPVLAAGALGVSHTAAPTTTRYRIESKTEQVVDLSAMGQANQTSSFTQLALITITISDSSGGKLMHVVIDSVATDAPVPGASEAAAKAKGAWLHGLVDDWGRTKIVKTSADSSDLIGQLKASLGRFFPVVRPGSKQGDSWIDTSNVDTKTAQQAVKSVTVTTYTHAGAQPHEGQTVTRIDASSSTTGAGTMENPMAGTMELEISDKGTETFYLSPDGRYLGGEGKSEGLSKVKTAMSPEPIPVKLTRTTSVTIVK